MTNPHPETVARGLYSSISSTVCKMVTQLTPAFVRVSLLLPDLHSGEGSASATSDSGAPVGGLRCARNASASQGALSTLYSAKCGGSR